MDSYDILNVTRDSSDKEIEIAYEDLKKKYDPSFNTSIHAYKKYREIQKAYENIKDEQRRKMYDLKDNEEQKKVEIKEYNLYDFDKEGAVVKKEIDYSKVKDVSVTKYKDLEVSVDISYLYYLLNLRCDLEYERKVKCNDCALTVVCETCAGQKVVEYQENMIWCPVCHGEGKVGVGCKTCGDSGYHVVKEKVSFYVDGEYKELKNYGDEYGNNTKTNLKVNFNFHDKDNVKINGDIIEVNYYLSKEETVTGINKEYFSEFGAFNLVVPSFVSNGYKQEIVFNSKKIIFTFYNEAYNGENKEYYLFINKSYKDKFIYFSDDYQKCSLEENLECSKLVKCSSKLVFVGFGEKGKYEGSNGDLIVNVEFNNDDDLIYTDRIEVLDTSKIFNLLGGKKGNIYHYGFRRGNSLIRRDDNYYLLRGKSKEKLKLKNYFLFKVLSAILWCLIPLLMFVIPYSQMMFVTLISALVGYFILMNVLMELEV